MYCSTPDDPVTIHTPALQVARAQWKCNIQIDSWPRINGNPEVLISATPSAGVPASPPELVTLLVEPTSSWICRFIQAVKLDAVVLAGAMPITQALSYLKDSPIAFKAWVFPIAPLPVWPDGPNDGDPPEYFRDKGIVAFMFSVELPPAPVEVAFDFEFVVEYEYQSIPAAEVKGEASGKWTFAPLPVPTVPGPAQPKAEIVLTGAMAGVFVGARPVLSPSTPPPYLQLSELRFSLSVKTSLVWKWELAVGKRGPGVAFLEFRVHVAVSFQLALVEPHHPESTGILVDVPLLPPMALKRFRAINALGAQLTLDMGAGDIIGIGISAGLEGQLGLQYPLAFGVRVAGWWEIVGRLFGFEKRLYGTKGWEACHDSPEDDLCPDLEAASAGARRGMAPQEHEEEHATVIDAARYRQSRPLGVVKGEVVDQTVVVARDAIPWARFSLAVGRGALEVRVFAAWTEHESGTDPSVSGTDPGGYSVVLASHRDPAPGEHVAVLVERHRVASPAWNDQQPHAAALPGSARFVVVWARAPARGVDPFAGTGSTHIMYLIYDDDDGAAALLPAVLTAGSHDTHPVVTANAEPQGPNPLLALVIWLRRVDERYRMGVAYMFADAPAFVNAGPLGHVLLRVSSCCLPTVLVAQQRL